MLIGELNGSALDYNALTQAKWIYKMIVSKEFVQTKKFLYDSTSTLHMVKL